MPNSTFELFECVCRELATRDDCVLTDRSVPESTHEEFKRTYKKPSIDQALDAAIGALQAHFRARDARLPFDYDAGTRVCTKRDADFVKFVAKTSDIRGNPAKSREFELAVFGRIAKKLNSGDFHHTGWPRTRKKRKAEYRSYLNTLGFDDIAVEKDQDAGFDILWLPPLGFVPLRPIVSVQCKNASVNIEEAGKSTAKASRSFKRHSTLRGEGTFLSFVIFNDYIDESHVKPMVGWNFAPLGITDAAPFAKQPGLVVL